MLSTIAPFQRAFTSKLIHRKQPTTLSEQTPEISIAVEGLGTELQRNIQHIEQPSPPPLSTSYIQRAAPTLTLLCDAAASTLSYSSTLLINSNKQERNIASTTAWAASSLFAGLEHTLLAPKKMLTAVLADGTNFAASLGGLTSALLSKHGQPQTLINGAAYLSNALLMTSGAISNIAVLQGEYNNAKQPSNHYLEKTAKVLIHLAGLADILSGITSIISTAKTNGNSTPLNVLSSNFWMTGSLLKTFSVVLQIRIKRLERTPTSPTTCEHEATIEEQRRQLESQIAQIAEQTTLIHQQRAELKVLNHVSSMQDVTIAKLRQETLRKRPSPNKQAQDDNHCTLPPPKRRLGHQRSLSETIPLLLTD